MSDEGRTHDEPPDADREPDDLALRTCAECGRLIRWDAHAVDQHGRDVHASCLGFRAWIDRGGTLD